MPAKRYDGHTCLEADLAEMTSSIEHLLPSQQSQSGMHLPPYPKIHRLHLLYVRVRLCLCICLCLCSYECRQNTATKNSNFSKSSCRKYQKCHITLDLDRSTRELLLDPLVQNRMFLSKRRGT